MNCRIITGALAAFIVVAIAFLVWRHEQRGAAPVSADAIGGIVQDDSGRRVLYWYDPMAPTQRFDRPGKSPFMDMQLVPKYADEQNDAGVRISAAVQQNVGVRIASVEPTDLADRITVVGRIEPNERRRYVLPSRVAGFVERLLVRAAGDPVSKGEKVAEIYSPDLLAAQHEYLALLRSAELNGAESLATAARQRLLLFGMAEREIDAIARSGQAQRRFGVYSPANGYVTELNVREGAKTEAGAALLSIADLSSVWLIAEAPEREAGRLQQGSEAVATIEGAPHDISGSVDFIYPSLNPQTRTTRVRVVLPNRNGELRPGMFARVHLGAAAREILSVPSESVIYSGSRTIVIVKENDEFRPVEVITGIEGEGRTEILSGLKAGEQVVASGQFLIDSEASLSGVLARLAEPDARAAVQTGERDMDREPTGKDAQGLVDGRGKVVSIDHARGRVTLAHEPIPALNWPEMTMPFRLAEPQIAHALSVGDVIRFTMRSQPENGEYVIESATKEDSR